MVSKLLPNFCTASIVSGGLLFWNLGTIGFLDVTCAETNGLEFIPMTSPSNDRAHERGQHAFFLSKNQLLPAEAVHNFSAISASNCS